MHNPNLLDLMLQGDEPHDDFVPADGVADESDGQRLEKSPRALKTISEAAEMLDVPQHVLRFWETKFSQIKPLKRNGGRRYYRPEDIDILVQIKSLLYKQGYTIKGARKAFEKNGHLDHVAEESDLKLPSLAIPSASSNDNDWRKPELAEEDTIRLQSSELARMKAELCGIRDALRRPSRNS